MVKTWRPLTQKELPDLSSGDTVMLRQNYLLNPDRLFAAHSDPDLPSQNSPLVLAADAKTGHLSETAK
jgi:hypothetical protein